MPTVLKNDVHNNIANIVYSGIKSRTTQAYFFLGRNLPWDNGQDATGAPVPTADRAFENETRSHIIGLRAITETDVSYAIPRNDWVSGTVYDMYDTRLSEIYPAPSGATDIADALMFVLTDEFNIYKCISNNYNSPSTVKPTGTDVGYTSTADGYVWKYMSTLDVISRSKFLTAEYVPVSKAIAGRYLTQEIVLTRVDGGAGYDPNKTTISIVGDGDDASFIPIIEGGVITGITAENAGTGYTQADVFVLTPGYSPTQEAVITADFNIGNVTGTQAAVETNAKDGEISFIYINSGGTGYSNQTYATIVGNGIDGDADVVITNGVITGITINNRGEGYDTASIVVTDPLATGSGASIDVIVSPTGGHGANIITESFASILGFHVNTLGDTNQNMALENDYRQTGLLFSPQTYIANPGDTQFNFTASAGSTCFRLNIEGPSTAADFELDEKLINGTTQDEIYVVAKDDLEDVGNVVVGVSLLVQSLSNTAPEIGDVFVRDSETPTTAFTIPSTNPTTSAAPIVEPQVDKYSGSMVFINNRTPFRKNAAQIVNLRTFIKF